MKNLLQKSLTTLTLFSFIIFACSVPLYFFVVDWIWLTELDENNQLIAQRIEQEFNKQNISQNKLEEHILFWNDIHALAKITSTEYPLLKDSIYTILRQNPYENIPAIDRFRGLIMPIRIHDKYYTLTIETNIEESEETLAFIAIVTFLLYIILIIGFWILTKKMSIKIWQPFHHTLQKLKAFQLHKTTNIDFQISDITEFNELNNVLNKLLQHNINTYKSQKEFTENAAHELQTPLAIIKNKLDVLLQKEALTNRQYQIIEEINIALTRITRINKNLLLLAKIENQQYEHTHTINISNTIENIIAQLQEHIQYKSLQFTANIDKDIFKKGNTILFEILIYNLLLNAIKHNYQAGFIKIEITNNNIIIANSGHFTLNKDLVFNRFTQLSKDYKGTGLGLAIIKQITDLHQWKIDYDFKNSAHYFIITF